MSAEKHSLKRRAVSYARMISHKTCMKTSQHLCHKVSKNSIGIILTPYCDRSQLGGKRGEVSQVHQVPSSVGEGDELIAK